MRAEIIFARTLRSQRLRERNQLLSLIKGFNPGHTKTPLPHTRADPNPPSPRPFPTPPPPPLKSSSLEGKRSLIYKLFITIYLSFCFVSFYSFSPQTLYLLDWYAAKYIGLIIACSRLRHGGEKSFSKQKCKKSEGAGQRLAVVACTHFFNGLSLYISS